MKLSSYGQDLDNTRPVRPGPVAMYEMKELRSFYPVYRQLEGFPGPLHGMAKKKVPPLGLYRRPMPRDLWWS